MVHGQGLSALLLPAHLLPARYFATHELRDLFTVDDRELVESQTQRQLHELHSHERRTDESLEGHLRSLRSISNFAGGRAWVGMTWCRMCKSRVEMG